MQLAQDSSSVKWNDAVKKNGHQGIAETMLYSVFFLSQNSRTGQIKWS